MTYSDRLQQRYAVVAACRKAHGNVHVAATLVGKPARFVRRWYKLWQETHDLHDSIRKGRPSAFTATVCAEAQQLLSLKQSCTEVTAELVSKGAIPARTHRCTTWRNVTKGENAMECGPEQLVPAITAYTKERRLKFQSYHEQAGTDWGKVMAIDSTIFRLGKQGGRRRVWRPKGSKSQRRVPSRSVKVHVYGGITAYGKTKLKRVTGTTGVQSNYFRGDVRLTGVGGGEARDTIQGTLVPDGE